MVDSNLHKITLKKILCCIFSPFHSFFACLKQELGKKPNRQEKRKQNLLLEMLKNVTAFSTPPVGIVDKANMDKKRTPFLERFLGSWKR